MGMESAEEMIGHAMASRAIRGKSVCGFPSGIASKQGVRAVRRFRETVKRSRRTPKLNALA
jgi:hypothetical protein